MSKTKEYKWKIVFDGKKFGVAPYKPEELGKVPWQGEMLGIGIGEFIFLVSTRERARFAEKSLNKKLAAISKRLQRKINCEFKFYIKKNLGAASAMVSFLSRSKPIDVETSINLLRKYSKYESIE